MRSFLDQDRLNRVTPPITAGEQDHHSWNREYHVDSVTVTLTPHQNVFLVTTLLAHNTRPDRYLSDLSLYRTMHDGVTVRERAISDVTLFQIDPNEVI